MKDLSANEPIVRGTAAYRGRGGRRQRYQCAYGGRWPIAVWAFLLGWLGAGWAVSPRAHAAEAPPAPPMTYGQAIVLGVVEGLTEYLPVSSTGHLFVIERLMGIAQNRSQQHVTDSFGIAIQFGAILAVVGIYRKRFGCLARGLIGRDACGQRLLIRLLLAFVPAVLVALLFHRWIRGFLFGSWPIVIAWAAGGIAILGIGRQKRQKGTASLENMRVGTALAIGMAQCLALWPGISRSLVTIAGGLALGLEKQAAVEFSFLLGVLTLGVATLHEVFRYGGEMIELFGWSRPLVGLICATLSAWVSVKWMLAYLHRHGFALFGWYRIGIAAIVAALLLGGVLS